MSRTLRGRIAAAVGAAALTALASPGHASADTVTVTSTADSGTGSLRQVIDDAADGDVIVLPPGTYQVSSAQISVDTSITIRGAGADRTTLLADGNNRVLGVNPPGPVEITDLTITGGGASGGSGVESGSADLTLRRVAVLDNGGAPGMQGNGGGISVNGADLRVFSSLIAGNYGYNGGGISFGGGTLLLESSTITDNDGGSLAAGDNGTGGAISGANPSTATIKRSTIFGNRAYNGQGSAAVGAVDLSFERSIVAGNTSFTAGSPATPGVENDDCSGTSIQSLGHNLEGATTCDFTAAGDRRNSDPLLSALADNGGPTPTLALAPRSPAVNAGGGSCGAGLDQRGVPRALGGRCDIGAYELVRCGGVIVSQVGTAAADTLVGTSGADGILGLGGNDLLRGLGGGDGLCGGKGRDRVLGGAGRDRLLGGAGRDKLLGGKGRDRLRGGPGRDRLRGGPGRDIQRQ